MTQDEIIRMAREAGFTDYYPERLTRFAALVAAHEREACAKVCENLPTPKDATTLTHIPTLETCAAAIRARGDK